MTEITYQTTDQDVASRSLTVTVPVDHLAAAERRAVKSYAKRARLPGFRKGHAPEPVIRRKFSAEIRQAVLEDALQSSWKQILADTELKPTGDPQVRDLSFEEGEPLTFSLLVEVVPSVTLTTTGGFTLTRTLEPVTDEKIEEQLTRLREEKAAWSPLEGVRPKDGQLVSVTVENLKDGEPEGGASPHSLEIGKGQAIPDLEEKILTMLPGETADAEVRLPDDHPDEARRGEARQVRITLHEVKEKLLPDLDEAFAAEVGKFDSVEALRAAIREDLASDATRSADAGLREELIGKLAEANEVPAPATLVRRVMAAYAEGYQVPAEQAEIFAKSFGPVAEMQVRRELILDSVVTAQNLRATEEEIDARVSEMAAARGVEAGKLYASLEQAKRLGELERHLTEEKAFAWLLGQNTVTEVEA
jgi:trigger factor